MYVIDDLSAMGFLAKKWACSCLGKDETGLLAFWLLHVGAVGSSLGHPNCEEYFEVYGS